MSKNKLLAEQRGFLQGLDLTMCADKKTAYLSPKRLLIRRLKYLHKRGFINLKDGTKQIVQVLGDATQIFKSMKVNGTVFVIKVIYPNQDKVEGMGVNRVNNQKAFAFYLGNDSRDDIEERLPLMAADLEDINDTGVYVNLSTGDNDDDEDVGSDDDGPVGERVHVRIGLRLGGDLKLLVALVGINSNAGSYPCPICEVGDFKARHQLHLTYDELREIGVRLRTVERQQMLAHCHPSIPHRCGADGFCRAAESIGERKIEQLHSMAVMRQTHRPRPHFDRNVGSGKIQT
jgi:hypothetical protein